MMTMGQVPGTPRKFRVRREGWNYYEVPQWSVEVAVRQVVLYALEIDSAKLPALNGVGVPEGTMAVNAAPFVVITTPKTGKPSPRPPEMKDFDKHGVHIDYKAVEEVVNEYLLVGNPERVFTTRIVIGGMRLLPGWYDAGGYPYVHVQQSLAIGLARPLRLEAGEV